MAVIGNLLTLVCGNPVELMPKTASGLSSQNGVSDRKSMALSDDISNYRFVQVLMYTTLNGEERQLEQMVCIPTYDGGDVVIAIYSDSNTGYYCYGMFKLSGSSLIIRRAYFGNYSSPSFRVIGIP